MASFATPSTQQGGLAIALSQPLANAGAGPRVLAVGAMRMYTISLIGNALAAYNIGPVPIPWIMYCVTIAYVIYLIVLRGQMPRYRMPGMSILTLLAAWGLLITVINYTLEDYSILMPRLATSPYKIFLSLRFMRIFAFMAQAYLTWWLLAEGLESLVIRRTTQIGALVAAAAIYIYIAQSYDLWEPLRTRMDGAGGEQSVTFTYAFHRAMGTFREPSHLAEWLVVPFFVSLLFRTAAPVIPCTLIGLVLLLTGSITGLIGAAAGLCLAMILINPLKASRFKAIARFGAILLMGLFLFSLVAVAYDRGHTNLIQVVYERVEPILFDDGMASTNRNSIYIFLAESSIPTLGYGLGNANLVLTEYFNVDVMVSFLSLYFNTLFAMGWAGLGLLLLFLLCPIFHTIKNRNSPSESVFLCMAAYYSWLVMYLVHSDELTIMFATIYAITCYYARQPSIVQHSTQHNTTRL